MSLEMPRAESKKKEKKAKEDAGSDDWGGGGGFDSGFGNDFGGGFGNDFGSGFGGAPVSNANSIVDLLLSYEEYSCGYVAVYPGPPLIQEQRIG